MYQSTEVIQISLTGIASDPARTPGRVPPAHQLRLIQQHLMTRTSMLEIIGAFNLFAEYPDLSPEQLVVRLREAIQIETGGVAPEGLGDNQAISVVSITATMPIAFQAQQVAHEVARRMSELGDKARIGHAGERLALLVAQENQLAVEIKATQGRIAVLRHQYGLALPGGSEFADPAVAGEQGELIRKLAHLRGALAETATRRVKTRAGLEMQIETASERTGVIEPAPVPDHPVTGSRKWYAIIGGVLSVVLAFVVAFVQELRNPVIRTGAQMQRKTGIAPLVSIPLLELTPARISLWQRYLAWLDEPGPNSGRTG